MDKLLVFFQTVLLIFSKALCLIFCGYLFCNGGVYRDI